jgi:hypothetical protein
MMLRLRHMVLVQVAAECDQSSTSDVIIYCSVYSYTQKYYFIKDLLLLAILAGREHAVQEYVDCD